MEGRARSARAAWCVGPAFSEVTSAAGKVRVEGSGQIWAYGQGQAGFRLVDDGKLIVRNVDANRVNSTGSGTKQVNGTTVTFIGFRGTVTVSGNTIALSYTGGQVQFEADGHTRIVLSGKGKYWIADMDAADWDEYGTTITMGSPTVSDEDQVWGDDAEYETKTVAAVQEIRTFPAYQE